LTADEKVAELNHIVEQSLQANEDLRLHLEQVGNDKVTFVREKIDELVHKEVQLKLNNIAANEGTKGNKSCFFETLGEDVSQMKS